MIEMIAIYVLGTNRSPIFQSRIQSKRLGIILSDKLSEIDSSSYLYLGGKGMSSIRSWVWSRMSLSMAGGPVVGSGKLRISASTSEPK